MRHHGVNPKTSQTEMFFNRLVKRQKHLSKWACRTGAGAYLLYDRDIPEIPLRAEYYACAESDAGSLSLSLYKRPYEKDENEEKQWLTAMKDAAAAALKLPPENIFLRERERQRGETQYTKLSGKNALLDICEYGLRYRINLSDYLDTGLFLDRRLFRALVRSEAAGKRVLNLFCYTASISVAALSGGALSADSVDLSRTYLDWARDNFALNGFTAPTLIRADALLFIEQARAKKQKWDMIILDPPAFSNSKKMNDDFDLKRDHGALIVKCLPLLAPGGTLYLSANAKGFKLDTQVSDGRGSLTIKDISEQLRDEDFKGKRIPATYRIYH